MGELISMSDSVGVCCGGMVMGNAMAVESCWFSSNRSRDYFLNDRFRKKASGAKVVSCFHCEHSVSPLYRFTRRETMDPFRTCAHKKRAHKLVA